MQRLNQTSDAKFFLTSLNLKIKVIIWQDNKGSKTYWSEHKLLAVEKIVACSL